MECRLDEIERRLDSSDNLEAQLADAEAELW
jgi:hypothetical protein